MLKGSARGAKAASMRMILTSFVTSLILRERVCVGISARQGFAKWAASVGLHIAALNFDPFSVRRSVLKMVHPYQQDVAFLRSYARIVQMTVVLCLVGNPSWRTLPHKEFSYSSRIPFWSIANPRSLSLRILDGLSRSLPWLPSMHCAGTELLYEALACLGCIAQL